MQKKAAKDLLLPWIFYNPFFSNQKNRPRLPKIIKEIINQ
jgi:hypothetical protein